MPREFVLLKNEPEVFTVCSNCGAEPFESAYRGIVQVFKWWGLRKKYCAIICYRCNVIIGYETPMSEAEYKLGKALGLHK